MDEECGATRKGLPRAPVLAELQLADNVYVLALCVLYRCPCLSAACLLLQLHRSQPPHTAMLAGVVTGQLAPVHG